MDSYLNIQSHYNKKPINRVKDIIIPKKKYDKRNKQIQICRAKMESRRFGKEIKDINNLTEMPCQSNSQVTKIGEILSKINKDADKSKYKENICIGIKIPSINKLIKNSKMANLIKVNLNNTNPNINQNQSVNININNNNNFIINNIPSYCNTKTSRHSSINSKQSNLIPVMRNTFKEINSHSKSNRRKYCRNSVIFKKIRKNSNVKSEDSRNNISFNKYISINIDDINKFKIQNYRDKRKEYEYRAMNFYKKNTNTINTINNYNNYSKIRISTNKENLDTSNNQNQSQNQNSNRNSNSKRDTHIMRFIRKQYNLPKEREKSNKVLNLSLNYRQKSKNKENQTNQINYKRKFQLSIPTGNEYISIIPINKKSADYRYKHSSKSINIPFSYPINENPQIPKEYINDIYNHLKLIEFDDLPIKNYMNIIQTDINEKMRMILLDWLVEVHIKFNLLTETLFITINLIDKYLSKKNIHRKYLQLLGITALLIACKYEEIYPPEIKELIHMTDDAYNKNQVLQMENQILDMANFNITFPTSFKFLEIFKNKLNLDDKNYYRCLYFIEVSLIDYKSSSINPSLLAANSLFYNYMNKNRIGDLNYDDNTLFIVTGYNKNDFVNCYSYLNNALKKLETIGNKYNSIRRKFKLDKYLNVSSQKFYIEENQYEINLKNDIQSLIEVPK